MAVQVELGGKNVYYEISRKGLHMIDIKQYQYQ